MTPPPLSELRILPRQTGANGKGEEKIKVYKKKRKKKDINNKYNGRCRGDMRGRGLRVNERNENIDSYHAGTFPGTGSG